MNLRPTIALTLGACLWMPLAGCNLREFTVNTTAPVMREAAKAFQTEPDVQFARDAAPGQLKTADGFLAASPSNRILLELCARGYIEYAFGFLEDDLESMPDDDKHSDARAHVAERATSMYDRALAFALRLLATDDKFFDAAFRKDAAAVESESAKLDQDSAPGLMLAGMSLASSINLNRTNLERVVDLPKAVALIKRAYALDKAYYNAAPAMTLGVLLASQGKAMGGDPDAAKKYFEEAISLTGGKYLLAKVMMARFYAVIAQDRALFDSTLKAVIATPLEAAPEFRLPNTLAKVRAARYLKQAEDLF